MSKELKQIRGQIRQIVKEMFPELLSHELIAALDKKLMETLKARLDKIDQRQKDIQGYVVRQSTLPLKKD